MFVVAAVAEHAIAAMHSEFDYLVIKVQDIR